MRENSKKRVKLLSKIIFVWATFLMISFSVTSVEAVSILSQQRTDITDDVDIIEPTPQIGILVAHIELSYDENDNIITAIGSYTYQDGFKELTKIENIDSHVQIQRIEGLEDSVAISIVDETNEKIIKLSGENDPALLKDLEKPLPTVASYTWYLYEEYSWKPIGNGDTIEYPVVNPGTYSFKLEVQKDSNSAEADKEITISEPIEPGSVPQVENLIIDYLDTGEIKLTWSEVEGDDISYKLYRYDENPEDSEPSSFIEGIIDNSHTERFEDIANYYRVSAIDNENEGEKSDYTEYLPPSHENNQIPIAVAGGPYFQWLGNDDSIVFNASGCFDPDGDSLEFRWDFDNDGIFDTTWAVENEFYTHSYSEIGNYTVDLEVREIDNHSSYASNESLAIVVGSIPRANAGGPYSGTVGMPITFNGNKSYDPNGVITSFQWDFGDGTNDSGMIVNHSYQNNETYNVTLTIFYDGGHNSNATVAVIFDPRNPISASIISCIQDDLNDKEFVLTAFATHNNGEDLSIEIDWADSVTTTPYFASGTVVNARHEFDEDGTYNVKVIAKAKSGEISDPTVVTITVETGTASSSDADQEISHIDKEDPYMMIIVLFLIMVILALVASILRVRFQKNNL